MIARVFAVAVLLAMISLAAPVGASAAANRDLNSGVAAPVAAPHVNVAIQAGHWKSNELPDVLARLRGNTGASGGGRTEAQVTVDIATRVVRMLRAQGLTAEVLPATVPTGYSADLFISLHADGNANSAPRGFKVSTRWRSDVAALDALLVQSVIDGYKATTGMPQDSSITRAMRGYYAYSTYRGEEYRLGADTPAAILEMGFMSNATDRNIMFNNPELVARGVVAGVNKFYAQRSTGLRLQAQATAAAAGSQYDRAAVILSDSANIRSGAGTNNPKVATALFGDAYTMLQGTNNGRPPSGANGSQYNGQGGTQLVTSDQWYKITIPGRSSPAYVSRDLVVVQQ